MKDRANKIAIDPKYNGYQRGLVSIFCKFFNKKIELQASVNEDLA